MPDIPFHMTSACRICVHLLASSFLLLSLSCRSTSGVINDPVSLPRRGDDIGSSGYRAGIGDAIDIFVLEDASFNGSYVVRASGDIILPKAGRIQIANLSLEQVESNVKRMLEGSQLTSATVIADPVRRGAGDGQGVASAGLTVYLSGSVMKSGRAFIPFIGRAQVTAYQAITDTGGFAAFANKRKSHILRRDQSRHTLRIPVDFQRIERGEDSDPALQDGDTIIVPQKLFGL